ncbi:NUDIX domain-containing protein [Eubacterium oxidoreducens]|uniref:ADP-ribose pyrophosphatase YjhB, NUDIX family n=1 Tax=Eubacterium oxidoreducens TaxID=1732 RepID=A0A1G6AWU8_EUBOX|nr:NUDIX hydrolase [Eubacterium oxidoreducens]SDB12842.1 ADP-ribose pyrophosphatase YjhB, NUDIX family [Eubacterium oxidoreducens]
MTQEEFLQEYKKQEYPKPSVTADIILFSEEEKENKVLLIKRGNHPYKDCYAFPGGFAEPGETIDETAQRELKEETGLDVKNLQPLRVFSDPNRDPRGWTMTQAYVAIIDAGKMPVKAGDDARDAKWFRISQIQENEERKILLISDEERIMIRVKGMEEKKLSPQITLIESENIAFDHGLIMAYAIHRYEYLQRMKEW